jgi:hypothetical protein
MDIFAVYIMGAFVAYLISLASRGSWTRTIIYMLIWLTTFLFFVIQMKEVLIK